MHPASVMGAGVLFDFLHSACYTKFSKGGFHMKSMYKPFII